MYAIKAAISDLAAASWTFGRQKTMYGGKLIAAGDTIFVFASENEGGPGLIARGVVASARAVARRTDVERQTPLVSIGVERTATAKRRLGRAELKPFDDWNDGRPETELNFKFYRQATNKIVGISEEAGAFLRSFFPAGRRDRVATPTLFAVIRVRGASWRADRPMRGQQAWPEHAAFMNGLAESRFIVRGGPLGDGRRVLHIVEADSEQVVRERLARDPWEAIGILRTESVEPWLVLLDRDAQDRPR